MKTTNQGILRVLGIIVGALTVFQLSTGSALAWAAGSGPDYSDVHRYYNFDSTHRLAAYAQIKMQPGSGGDLIRPYYASVATQVYSGGAWQTVRFCNTQEVDIVAYLNGTGNTGIRQDNASYTNWGWTTGYSNRYTSEWVFELSYDGTNTVDGGSCTGTWATQKSIFIYDAEFAL